MRIFKKFLTILIISFLLISFCGMPVLAESEITTEEVSDVVKNEALNEDYFKGDEPPKEFSYSSDNEMNLKSRAAVVFKVGYVYAAKAKTSDKYASVVKFKELKSYSDFNDALSKMNAYYDSYKSKGDTANLKKAYGMCIMNSSGKVIAMKDGRAYVSSSNSTLSFDENYAGSKPYVSNHVEVFYYGSSKLSSTQSKCKVGVSGMVNYTSSANLTLIPRALISQVYVSGSSSTKKYRVATYSVNSSGDLVHSISNLTDPSRSKYFESGEKTSLTSFVVDKAPSFMKKGVSYFSMDGVNFYTDGYLKSSSKVGTYYPYYTYLPYRTKTSYSASQLNSRIKNYASNSKLRNQGDNLIKVQNKYGINALLELSFANLESAYGTSWYALNRNNLFGIAAYDSDPDNAYSFSSPGKCIEEHAYRHLSRGYFDADSDFRYYGTAPGNKKIGVNVKYASDPYHGEKIGGIAYQQDKLMGSKDYGKYTIGISKESCYVYQKPSTSSKAFYKLATKTLSEPKGIPVVILGTSGDFYKVQTEMGVKGNICTYSYEYDYSKSVGYIPKKYISIVRKGKANTEEDKPKPPSKVELSVSSPSVKPSLSYGFTPGYGNNLKVQSTVWANVEGSQVELRVYDAKERLVAKQIKQKKTTKKTTATFYWDGKATKENQAGYKAGQYVKSSSKGTKYLFRVTISAKGKIAKTKFYSTKVYSKATRLFTDISKTTIKRGSSTVLSMYPNRPGTSYIRIYNSKGKFVATYVMYYKKANVRCAATFKGYATSKNNAGYKVGAKLPAGSYKVKFIHGKYVYTYPKKLVLK